MPKGIYRMKKGGSKMFKVKARSLLIIAGLVWFMAGFNVARLGILSYQGLETKSLLYPLSLLVFVIFSRIFYKMTCKHIRRILGYGEDRPFWHFFDQKSYLIMACMMGGGLGLRGLGVLPQGFIAFFYTGLGSALALAGLVFIQNYIQSGQTRQEEA